MMMLLILAALAFIAAAVMVIPLLKRPTSIADRTAQKLSGYRAQLTELQSDVEQGRVDAAQAQNIRSEIRHKILSLARAQKEILTIWKTDPSLALNMAAIVMIGSSAVYYQLGAPDIPDQPLASRIHMELIRRAANGNPDAQTVLLNQKLTRETGSFEDWWTLANLYRSKQQYKQALTAMQKASEFKKGNWQLQISTAEMMILAANGKVSLEAKTLMELIIVQQPRDFRSHYYLGLYEAQVKNHDKALKIWLALLKNTPDKAPWLHRLRVSIADIARAQNKDPLKILPQKHAAIYQKSPDYQLIQLQTRVKKSNKDVEAWLELARMYARYGNKHQASGSLTRLQELFPGDANIKSKAAAITKEFKLSALDKPNAGLEPSSPPPNQSSKSSHEDGDTAAINDMVASLAHKLKNNPDNLSGWQMLIRSYLQLNRNKQAKTALDSAKQKFYNNKSAMAALNKTANEFGIRSN